MADRGQIEEIKQKLDIVEVVRKYVPTLKKSGANHFGLCPFHNEKTPSFSVNQDLQIFKCFGCGEGGDVIKFIQKIEGLDFPQALERTAKLAGVVLKSDVYDDKKYKKIYEKKQKILQANKLSAKYFSYILNDHKKGKRARLYCKKRGLSRGVLKRYSIGYAPDGFNNLKNFLLKKGFEVNDLVSFGLLVKKNGKIYDKFRDRLMFPIFNVQGEVIGFSGRIINKSDFGPKYLNSPETLVYKKKNTLYGLYQAKEAIRKLDFVILVEGNIDILSSSRIGYSNIVCPLGTALTLEQCRLISRYTKNVYIAFDSDEAGKKAFIRSLDLLDQMEINVKVLDLHGFQDVDELITNKPELFEKILNKPLNVFDFLIKINKDNFDLSNVKQKIEFVKELQSFIDSIHNDVEREEYLKKIAIITELDLKQVKDIILRSNRKIHQKSSDHDVNHTQNIIDKKVSDKQKKKFLGAYFLQVKPDLKEFRHLDFIFKKWFLDILDNLDNIDKGFLSKLDRAQREMVEELLLYKLDLEDEYLSHSVNAVYSYLLAKKIKLKINQLKKKIKKSEYEDKDSDKYLKQVRELVKILNNLK